MASKYRRLLRYLCLAATVAGFCSTTSANSHRLVLEQGWSDEVRELFWFTSQGSRIIPYNWFLALEREESESLFRDNAHMDELGYLPAPVSDLNPDGLPIGFVADGDSESEEKWLGFTCAACHTNQLDHNGRQYLIEGAPTLANFDVFFSRLVDSLLATSTDPDKFDRFASRVISFPDNEDLTSELERNLKIVTGNLDQRRTVNRLPSGYPQDFSGHGRLDAFGQISNAASALALAKPDNRNAPTAPVSYPFLWGAHQSDVVQWNGSASNRTSLGPLVRNIGEVVGVFGGLSINKIPFRLERHRYDHSVALSNLIDLEAWVRDLRSPQWPEGMRAIDSAKSARGETLYESNCADCHEVVPRDSEGDRYVAKMTSLSAVGTDPAMASNAACNRALTHSLEGEEKYIITWRGDFESETAAINIAVNGVVGILLEDPQETLQVVRKIIEDEREQSDGRSYSNVDDMTSGLLTELMARRDQEKGCPDGTPNLDALAYKARPLNGIWATAPYLHNGSVPSLWDLLKRPEDRPTEFTVGNREFDPVNVGFSTEGGPSTFRVTQSGGAIQTGNSNRGHDYGTELSADEKLDLIEYMRTL